jgi:UDP-N-acetylenolpyruvoylglucosamine reductase
VEVTQKVLLADYTTLRLGGPAGRFVTAGSEDELTGLVRAADAEGEPALVLGGGSNLVVADDGFPGTVVRIASTGVRFAAAGDAVDVTVAAGEDWDSLVQRCIGEGLSGIECLSGIPGLTGATPIQNVGAYGQEVAQTILAVRVYDRLLDSELQMTGAECDFGYRTSVFKRRALAGSRWPMRARPSCSCAGARAWCWMRPTRIRAAPARSSPTRWSRQPSWRTSRPGTQRGPAGTRLPPYPTGRRATAWSSCLPPG